jgi:hypothetical protein
VTTPLSIDPAFLQEHRLDRWLRWFPPVGWFIGTYRHVRRIDRAKQKVRALLDAREAFPAADWAAAGFDAAFAETIARALPSRLEYLPNHYFSRQRDSGAAAMTRADVCHAPAH